MKLSNVLLSCVLLLGAAHLQANEPVNINTASPEAIAAAISGVGLKRAEQIVKHRESYGPFTSIEQLSDVDGIGLKTVERNRSQLRVE
ncbi:MAG: helix-hairpin-helix domain-containing protein [Gammaproteobacteria bacterium]|nr:helix-hairpin-helix domain-containing protein [Gammaproteobacteria bacterium]